MQSMHDVLGARIVIVVVAVLLMHIYSSQFVVALTTIMIIHLIHLFNLTLICPCRLVFYALTYIYVCMRICFLAPQPARRRFD